jgi:PAS domain S-box-containing protein
MNVKIKHLGISLLVIAFVTIPLYFFTPFLIDLFLNPQQHIKIGNFFNNYSVSDFQVLVLSILTYTSVVLIGYVVYLIATASTRAELVSRFQNQNLIASKFELQELYENAPVPYITINKNAEIRGCNKSALRFFGVVPEEIQTKNLFAYASDEDIELAKKFNDFYKADVPINKQEIRLRTKSDDIKWVSLSIFLTKDSFTKEKNGLVTVFDITEQKQLDQAKTEFVSLASHQLRTPLATMKWYTEMLNSNQLGDLNDKQKEYLTKMYSVNAEMIDLVEILLNVSRIEIGTLSISKQATNISEIIDSILVELASQISKKKIVFNKKYGTVSDAGVNTGADPVIVESDPKLLRIVIQNLITNAIKYNKEGGSVTIGVSKGFGIGQSSIVVSDTGLGIPKEDQERIFSKLFRAKNVKDVGSSQSTGLGLYLVKSVVKALGGNISFTSEENVGSTFTLRL